MCSYGGILDVLILCIQDVVAYCLRLSTLIRLDPDTMIVNMVGLFPLVTFVTGDTDVLHGLYNVLMMMASFVYLICCV